jgi:hypothetical protein
MQFAKIKAGVMYLLNQAQANSRFALLIHAVGVAVGTVALVVGFLLCNNPARMPFYSGMVIALGGSGGIAAAGRWMTKKSSGDAPPDATVPDAAAPDTPKV